MQRTRARESCRIQYSVAEQHEGPGCCESRPLICTADNTTNESSDCFCGGYESPSGYRCIKYISRGSQGFVMLASDSEGKLHALKCIPLTKADMKYSEREIMNQFKLKHPHIIKLEQLLVTDQHLILVMEYAVGGDLFSLVFSNNGLSESDSRYYFQQLLLAVDFCQRMGVSNRDIKLENLLLTSSGNGNSSRDMLKMADFGFSKDVNNDSTPITRLGTLNYIAPEVLQQSGEDRTSKYDACQADVWSCGVVLYAMLSAQYPFKKSSQLLSNIGKGFDRCHANIFDEPFQPLSGVSEACNNLLAGMLNADPKARLTVTQIMEHSWFENTLNAEQLIQFNNRVVDSLQTRSKHVEELMTQFRQQLQQRSVSNS